MSEETLQRSQSLEPLYSLTTSLAETVGVSAEERINWLIVQTGESFGRLLTDVNATVRDLLPEEHSFDGDGIKAGEIRRSIPPDQEDKVGLLDELVRQSQAHAQWRLGEGADAQTVMSELAMAMPTVVNKLHLFDEGNGRTSRILRMVLRDADQLMPDKVDVLVHKKGLQTYDTSPIDPVEMAVMQTMRTDNHTAEGYAIQNDVDNGEAMPDEMFGNDDLELVLKDRLPGVDSRVIKAYRDSFNFMETIRLMAKEEGMGGQISLKSMIEQTTTREGLESFLQTYRGVRKQRAELLMSGLIGTRELPLPGDNDREVYLWANYARKPMGLSLVDPSQIHYARQLQMAYMETFSPQRAEAA